MSSCKTRDLPVESEKAAGQLENTYAYYSKELKQVFDTLEELKAAELKLHEEQDAKVKLQKEKKERAKEVEDAYLHYTEVKEKAYKEISEAESKWVELRNKFAEDYGSYHMTYCNNNGEKTVTFSDLVNTLWNW